MLGFTSSKTFKAKPFWQSDAGQRHLVLNVPQSYPALPMSGTLASGFVALDLEKAIYPSDELSVFESMNYRVDADMSLIEESKAAFVEDLHKVLKNRHTALKHFRNRESWDTTMFVITGTDRINHYLWDDYEDTDSPLHQTFLDFYAAVDAVIEEVCEHLEEETKLLVVSDHGFARQKISVNVNSILFDEGYLKLDNYDRPSYVNMTNETRAFAMDPGRIYIHSEGKYPKGCVSQEDKNKLIDDLRGLFLSYKIDGANIVDNVYEGTEIYEGPYAHRAPDLILMAAENIGLSGRMNPNEKIESTLINGKHTYEQATFFLRSDSSEHVPKEVRVEDCLSLVNSEITSLS